MQHAQWTKMAFVLANTLALVLGEFFSVGKLKTIEK